MLYTYTPRGSYVNLSSAGGLSHGTSHFILIGFTTKSLTRGRPANTLKRTLQQALNLIFLRLL